MPVYNGEPYIREAIDSVLNQTYQDFELIIINDGSTDDSVQIIESYKDSRIRLIHNEQNEGLAFTQNVGLDVAQGKYIAKIDCDDKMLPDRIMKQVFFLDAHPEIGMVGSSVAVIDSSGNSTGTTWIYNAPSIYIPSIMLFTNYFIHPAIMIRKAALGKERYKTEFNPAEDYNLFVRILTNGYGGANLKEVLTLYRMHSSNISVTQRQIQINSLQETRRIQLSKMGIELNPTQLALLNSFVDKKLETVKDVREVKSILGEIIRANYELRKYDFDALQRVINHLWGKNLVAMLKRGSFSAGLNSVSYGVLHTLIWKINNL